jgi:hypothetical protein
VTKSANSGDKLLGDRLIGVYLRLSAAKKIALVNQSPAVAESAPQMQSPWEQQQQVLTFLYRSTILGMKTLSPPQPAIDLTKHLYYRLVYTLTDLLPPPLDDSPEALRTRNHAAIAKVAALLPVNANEADLAAQCIAARAQAEEMLRLLRQNAAGGG